MRRVSLLTIALVAGLSLAPHAQGDGGYRLVPESYEFWEHRENRLHDRVRYRRDGETWRIEHLSP